jgi:hypothetical protein
MLVGGNKNKYICECGDNYNWIMNIISPHSFTMDGGILKYGNLKPNSTILYYFVVIEGFDAYFHIKHVDIKFITKAYNFVQMMGGIVCMEYVKIENEVENWKSPLILGVSLNYSIIIDLFSLFIYNCYHECIGWNFAGIVFLPSEYGHLHPAVVNISSLFLQNTTFIPSILQSRSGPFCLLIHNYLSCLLFFISLFFFIFSNFCYK